MLKGIVTKFEPLVDGSVKLSVSCQREDLHKIVGLYLQDVVISNTEWQKQEVTSLEDVSVCLVELEKAILNLSRSLGEALSAPTAEKTQPDTIPIPCDNRPIEEEGAASG